MQIQSQNEIIKQQSDIIHIQKGKHWWIPKQYQDHNTKTKVSMAKRKLKSNPERILTEDLIKYRHGLVSKLLEAGKAKNIVHSGL